MKRKMTPYVLMLPQIILGVIFAAGLLTGMIQSLGLIPALGLHKPTLQYYKEIFTRPDMMDSVIYSLYIAAVSASVAVILGVLVCTVLVMRGSTKGTMMRVVQLPIIVPHVVVALFMINILSQNGLLARAAYAFGLIEEQQQFVQLLYDRQGIGIILAYLWKEIPFVVYFVIALMANINGRLGEAAVNLGASPWKSFCKVTLPLCMHTILSSFLIIFVFALGAYELPLILGPTSPKALPVQTYIQYTHPDLRNRPYAMALNGIIIVISLLSAVLYFILMKKSTKIWNGKGGTRS